MTADETSRKAVARRVGEALGAEGARGVRLGNHNDPAALGRVCRGTQGLRKAVSAHATVLAPVARDPQAK